MMTREEAKELLPIIQAFANGAQIQVDDADYGNRWRDTECPSFDTDFEYRVKPKCRPFKSADECWDVMLCHSPFGWIKNERGISSTITLVSNNYHTTVLVNGEELTFEELANHWCFVDDGVPFGVKEEEA